jgi:hypothetical protein
MTLQNLRDTLLTIGPPVFHYSASGQTGNYIVWAEDGEGPSGHADNHKTTQVLTGTIDYFTKTEFDPVIQQIEGALNSTDIAWRLSSVQHEKDTGYIHHEWTWEIV